MERFLKKKLWAWPKFTTGFRGYMLLEYQPLQSSNNQNQYEKSLKSWKSFYKKRNRLRSEKIKGTTVHSKNIQYWNKKTKNITLLPSSKLLEETSIHTTSVLICHDICSHMSSYISLRLSNMFQNKGYCKFQKNETNL